MSADRVFIVAPVSQVRGAVIDPAAWQHWWPSWQVRISEDRGQLGARLHITAPWPGTSELYLEAHRDGVIVGDADVRVEFLGPAAHVGADFWVLPKGLKQPEERALLR